MIKIPTTEAQRIHRDLVVEKIRAQPTLCVAKVIALAVGGIAAILFPIFFSSLFVLLLGGLLVAAGIVMIAIQFGPERDAQFLLHIVYALVAIAAGIVLVVSPTEGVFLTTSLLVAFLLADGLFKVIFVIKLRPFENWRFVLITGAGAVLLATYFWLNLPMVALWLIGVLVGVQLLSEAFTLGWLVFENRRKPD